MMTFPIDFSFQREDGDCVKKGNYSLSVIHLSHRLFWQLRSKHTLCLRQLSKGDFSKGLSQTVYGIAPASNSKEDFLIPDATEEMDGLESRCDVFFYASDNPMQCPFSEVIEGKGHEDIYASAREGIYRIRKGAGGNRWCWTAKRTIREASTPSSSVDSPTRDLRKAGQRVWVCSGNRVIISVPSLCVCTKMFWRENCSRLRLWHHHHHPKASRLRFSLSLFQRNFLLLLSFP